MYLNIISINSGHELLGSPILIDARALIARRQRVMEGRRGLWRSLQPVGISSLSCTYRQPLTHSSTRFLKTSSTTLWFNFQHSRPSSHALRLVTTSNAPPSTSYRSCWHVVGPGFFSGIKSRFCPAIGLYDCLSLHGSMNHSSPQNAGSNFRLLTNILHCCRRWGVFQPPCDCWIFQNS